MASDAAECAVFPGLLKARELGLNAPRHIAYRRHDLSLPGVTYDLNLRWTQFVPKVSDVRAHIGINLVLQAIKLHMLRRTLQLTTDLLPALASNIEVHRCISQRL